MKSPLQVAVGLLLIQASAQASIIYSNDFSGNFSPGWIRTTFGDNSFHTNWSISSSLESTSGNQHGRFDIDIPTEPTNSNARWYGGFYTFASPNTNLPSQWRLSFDISLPTVEPIQISFMLVPTNRPFAGTTLNFWAQPAGPGWQQIVIDQNTPYSMVSFPLGSQIGTSLSISMASHDPQGNPLTISQVGTYDFLLDNVLLQSVPEPSSLGLFIAVACLCVGAHRRSIRR